MIDLPFLQRFACSSKVFALLCSFEDAKEGVGAFLAKLKPVWQGK
jgi:hypothetical protein